MRKFDYEKASLGEDIQMRAGNTARIICNDRSSYKNKYPLVVLITLDNGREITRCYN